MHTDSRLRTLIAAAIGFGAAATSQAVPANEAVIHDLTTTAAAIRDYHYCLEWTTPGGDDLSTAEVWYAGPDHVRTMAWTRGRRLLLRETLVRGDEGYAVNSHSCQVMRFDRSGRAGHLGRFLDHTLPAVFLGAEELARWAKAEVKGTETVGGVACRVVDVAPEQAALWGSLEEEGDFVAFIPRRAPSTGDRLWIDPATGMVRRWAHTYAGRVSETCEVTETQHVNGHLFPAVVIFNDGSVRMIGRITQAAVNQGVADAMAQFRPPRNWLVLDATLTIDEVVKRLQVHPHDASLHYTLGSLHQQKDREREATKAFRRAAELAPASPTPLVALARGLRWYEQDSSEMAIDALHQALARAGDDGAHVRALLVQALVTAGRTDEALAAYRTLAEDGALPDSSAATQLASALARRGDFETAYRLVCDIPLSVLANRWLGVGPIVEWAGKSHHLDDLHTRAARALVADPESVAARLVLARVLHAQGRDAEAAAALKAIALHSESADSRLPHEVISLAAELGDEGFAAGVRRAAFRQAIESDPGYDVISTLLLSADHPPGALADLVRETATLWRQAADPQRRTDILEAVSKAAGSVRARAEGAVLRLIVAGRPEEGMPVPDLDGLTADQCAIWGAVLATVAIHAPRYTREEPEVANEARRRAGAYLERAIRESSDAALWAKIGELRRSAVRRGEVGWDSVADAYRQAAAAEPGEIEYPARVAFALVRTPVTAPGPVDTCGEPLAIGRKAMEPWPEEWVAKTFFASLQMDCSWFQPARDTLLAVYPLPAVGKSRQKSSVGRLLARCHERLGETDQAEQVLKRGVEDAGSDPGEVMDAYQRLIQFYGRHRRQRDAYAAAKAMYVRGKDRGWNSGVAYWVQDAFGEDREALVAAVRADLEAHPDDIDTLGFAGAVYERWTGRLKDALPLLRQAAERTNDAEAWTRLADAAERAKDAALLIQALRRALDLTPEDRRLQLRYARATAAQGDTAPAKALADELRADAGESPQSWREVAELYLTAQSWDDAVAAAERLLALTPETDESARMRAEVLVARACVGKRDDHEARKRLIPILAQSKDPGVLREAADVLVNLYLLRGERERAISTLNDLRLRTKDRALLRWIDERLKEIGGG